MTLPALATALRAQAQGLYYLEATAELLVSHQSFLHRNDFTGRFIHRGTSITDGVTEMAEIDWPAAIAALNGGELPCSGGEHRILRIAASLAAGIPVDLRNAVTGLDHRNINLVITAVLHASGALAAAQRIP